MGAAVLGFCSELSWNPDATPAQSIALRPFATMLDWLSVTGTGPFWAVKMPVGAWSKWDGLNLRPGAMLQRLDAPAGWGARFVLAEPHGDKLATILAAPIDRKRHARDAIVITFGNATLATGEFREIGASLWAMGCIFERVQRMDIAADGWQRTDGMIGGGGDYIPVVQAALAGWGRYYGKARWATEHLGNDWNGFVFGTRGANKFLRCYRKKREMKAKGRKPHIERAWSAALGGYDAMKDPREVGRLEVQLQGKELERYYPTAGDWSAVTMVHDAKVRAGIHHATARTIFDFRSWPKDGRARSAHPMAVWDYSQAGAAMPPRFVRASRKPGVSEHGTKVALRYLHDIAYLAARPDWLQAAVDISRAAGDGMADYFNRRQQSWVAACDRLTESAPVADGLYVLTLREMERAEWMRRLLASLGVGWANDPQRLRERLRDWVESASKRGVVDVVDLDESSIFEPIDP